MATYLQLESEQVWHDQIVPPFMTGFLIVPLRDFYGLDANSCGAPGDNNHLYGRHRSANWDLQSRYCTDRAYGTTDARDHLGDQNWYRAVDIGIQGQTLHDACHRIDTAVRSGLLPEVAEWFGTFDGVNVVGWYEGHPSSSDTSHLYHMHVGFWNEYADNFQVMQRVFGIVTGQESGMGLEEWTASPGANSWALTQGNPGFAGQQRDTALAFAWEAAHNAAADAAAAKALCQQILDKLNAAVPPSGVAQHSHEGGTSGPVAE